MFTRPLALETRLDDLPPSAALGPPSAAASDDDSAFDLDVDSGLDDSDLDDFDLERPDFDGDFDLDDLFLGASELDDFDDEIGDSDVDVGVGPAAAVQDLAPRDRPLLSCDLYDVCAAWSNTKARVGQEKTPDTVSTGVSYHIPGTVYRTRGTVTHY